MSFCLRSPVVNNEGDDIVYRIMNCDNKIPCSKARSEGTCEDVCRRSVSADIEAPVSTCPSRVNGPGTLPGIPFSYWSCANVKVYKVDPEGNSQGARDRY